MNSKLWVSIVTGTAAVLLVTMTMGLLPSSASAAMYVEQTEAYTEEYTEETLVLDITATPYGQYEMLSDEEKASWQNRQKILEEEQQRQQKQQAWQNHQRFLQEQQQKQQQDMQRSRVRFLVEELTEEEWVHPLTVDTYITSPYGWRVNPVHGGYEMHKGVDLNAYRGDEIRAARSGVVITAEYCSGRGYYVQIDHGDGFVTEYFHMTYYIVEEGQEVRGGERIGYVGSTGWSTGSHLHFGMMYEGDYVNPVDYIDF